MNNKFTNYKIWFLVILNIFMIFVCLPLGWGNLGCVLLCIEVLVIIIVFSRRYINSGKKEGIEPKHVKICSIIAIIFQVIGFVWVGLIAFALMPLKTHGISGIQETCLYIGLSTFAWDSVGMGVLLIVYSYMLKRKREENEKIRIEEEKKREYEAEVERQRKEKEMELLEEQQIQELKEKFADPSYYVEKYKFYVENLIREILRLEYGYFNILKNSHCCMMVTESSLVKKIMLEDGYKQVGHYDEKEILYSEITFYEEIVQLIKIYASKVRQELKSENKFSDDETDYIIYLTIKNNVINHFANEYIKNYSYDTLEGLVDNIPINDSIINIFVYYYVSKQEKSVNLVEEYNSIYNKAQELVKEKDLREKQNKIFKQKYITTNKVHNSEAKRDVSFIEKIDSMTGRDFEIFISKFFTYLGYKTTITPSSGDYGIDVIAENDFVKIGIQTKCYSSDKISNSAVQEAVTGLKHYGLDKAMVITNSYFQPSAIKLAEENKVILWNRDRLIKEISEVDKK